jgi:rfaE bifunctional protein nucleotidyltransferase chain/domain
MMLELGRGNEHVPTDRKILLPEVVTQVREELTGLKIVAASGVFDLLHPGHVSHLEEARAQGDVLFVGISPDKKVREKKGNDRPIQTQDARAKVIAALGCVDYVVLMPHAPDAVFLAQLKPAVWARGLDHTWEDMDPPTKKFVTDSHMLVVRVGGMSYRSSDLIQKIKQGE